MCGHIQTFKLTDRSSISVNITLMCPFLQVVEGQLDVLEVEVEQLGDQVEQAVQNWSLEELSRPYSRLSSLKQELLHQAALRYTVILLSEYSAHLSVCVPVCHHCPPVSCQGSEVKGGPPSPRVQTGVVRLGGLDEPTETDSRVSGAGQRLPACSGNISSNISLIVSEHH